VKKNREAKQRLNDGTKNNNILMTDNLKVIPCDFNDPRHCEALVNLMNEYISDDMGERKSYTEEQKTQLLEGLRNHPSRLILLAQGDEQFVGLCNCFINFATFTVKPFINIHDVIVTRSCRNRKVGRRIIEKVIEQAGKLGCSKVTLEVREDNLNAQHLYHQLGFSDAQPRQFYWTRYV
jgi:ribosomal protein S18 acetylase RimI-like enzyme